MNAPIVTVDDLRFLNLIMPDGEPLLCGYAFEIIEREFPDGIPLTAEGLYQIANLDAANDPYRSARLHHVLRAIFPARQVPLPRIYFQPAGATGAISWRTARKLESEIALFGVVPGRLRNGHES